MGGASVQPPQSLPLRPPVPLSQKRTRSEARWQPSRLPAGQSFFRLSVALVLLCRPVASQGYVEKSGAYPGWIKECYDQADNSTKRLPDGSPDPREKSLGCGRRFAIFNLAVVYEFWEVHELEFYWNEGCTNQLPVWGAIGSEVMDHEDWEENTEKMAVDEDLITRFTSNCRDLPVIRDNGQFIGGCEPYQAYIGVDIGVDGQPIVDHHSEKWAKVRCVRLFQSPNATRQSREIAIAMWVNASDDAYIITDTYGDLSGGSWHTRPALEQALWRIWNMVPIDAPWEVAEMVMYTDLFCTRPYYGVPISSGTFFRDGYNRFSERLYCVERDTCDEFLPINTFNGITLQGEKYPEPLPTRWVAPCHAWTGCEKEAAWIGMDFDRSPMTIKCVRLWQPAPPGISKSAEYTHSTEMLMQYWDGFMWQDNQYFANQGFGGWNDTVPEPNRAWRIENYDRILSSWHVYEVEFYQDRDCGTSGGPFPKYPKMAGEPADSNAPLTFLEQEMACETVGLAFCAALAYDTKLETGWKSSCDPCMQGQAWIGQNFRTIVEDVTCFRIMQSGLRKHMTEAVQLSSWDGKQWVERRLESAIGGGTWNYRPAEPRSTWYLVASAQTTEPWTVVGVAFYEDSVCNDEVEPGVEAQPVGVGNENNFPPTLAFDKHDETEWRSECLPPGSNESGCAIAAAWIGLQAYEGIFEVKCVRLSQHRDWRKQTRSAFVQYWDGSGFRLSSLPTFDELGGGHWQSLPGFRGSMWRVAADTAPGHGVGVGITEIKFFKSPDCLNTTEVAASRPNVMPITSGYATARQVADDTGYGAHYRFMSDAASMDGFYATDGDLNTFWADLGPGTKWFGIDLATQVTDVACIRVMWVGAKAMQPNSAELQGWDGRGWATKQAAMDIWDTSSRQLFLSAPDISSMGWQSRPSPDRSMWRLENSDAVAGWDIKEVEMHVSSTCSSGRLLGPAISSPVTVTDQMPLGGHIFAEEAFDTDPTTYWQAECPPQTQGDDGEMLGGCSPGRAWIGQDFGTIKIVRCVRFMQSGDHGKMVGNMWLSSWNQLGWGKEMFYDGLGGDTWNIRPAAPDTLWRVVHMKRADEECKGEGRPEYRRTWGISEIEFYADDDCEVRLPGPNEGANVIASGSAKPTSMQSGSSNPFAPDKAFDENLNSQWRAPCGPAPSWPPAHPKDKQCGSGEQWIGLDFTAATNGLPVEVRCMKVYQSRMEGNECCDPASEIRLDRWNGTTFVPVMWKHVPRDEPMLLIPGIFGRMAPCPPYSPANVLKDTPVYDDWDLRGRRQSDQCEIPLTGAVRLMSDQLCEKHPKCVEAGFVGFCCPVDVPSAISKCCCDFLVPEKSAVFEDEMLVGLNRKPLDTAPIVGIEYVIIRITMVMPVVGGVATLFFYFLVLFPHRHEHQRLFFFYDTFCTPIHRWLRCGTTYANMVCFFTLSYPKDKLAKILTKRLIGVVIGAYVGACFLWILFAYIAAELFMKVVLAVTVIIKNASSPYNPQDKGDRKRMCVILGVPFDADVEYPNFGNVIGSLAKTAAAVITSAVRCVFDIIIMRFAAMNLGAVDLSLSVPAILEQVPELPIDLGPIMDQLYYLMSLTSWIFSTTFMELFVGIPRCEGPVLVFSACWLIAITMILVKWLNYDYFALFVTTKAVVGSTRPTFQKTMYTTVVMVIQSGMFYMLQMIMLLFSRAMTLVNVNPFQSDTRWDCPYEYEVVSIIVGRVHFLVSATVALFITFLCANGHFIGHPDIIKPMEDKLGFDLSKLDPETSAMETPGLIRWGSYLSMIPTACGIWIDWWNVKGFLIKERATVYATEMRFPDTCPHCGEAHVPYDQVMTATGKQLSLAFQLIPCGAILGKGVEYLNNPPLLYIGTKLKCYTVNENMDAASEGMPKKMPWNKEKFKYMLGYGSACAQDLALPFFQRFVSIMVYVVLLVFTFGLTPDNVDTLAITLFKYLGMLVSAKALAEVTLPIIMLFLLGISLIMTNRLKKSVSKKESRRKLALAGMVLHGVSTGLGISLYATGEPDWGFSKQNGLMLGTVGGTIMAWFIVAQCYFLEITTKGGSIMGGEMWKAFYASCLSFGITYCVAYRESMKVFLFFATVGGGIMIPMTIIGFKPSPMKKDQRSVPEHETATKPLISFPRGLSPPLAICTGVFVGTMGMEHLVGIFGFYGGIGIGFQLSIFIGIMMSYSFDTKIDQKSGQYAILTSIVVGAPLGLLIHWTLGVLAGSIAGNIAGFIVESKDTVQLKKESYEEPKFKQVRFEHSTLLDSKMGDVRGGDGQDVVVTGTHGALKVHTITDRPAASLVAWGGPILNDQDKEWLNNTDQHKAAAPLSPELARGYLEALRQQYVLGMDGAVSSFLDQEPDANTIATTLEPFEAEIRSAGDREQAIAQLAARWQIDFLEPISPGSEQLAVSSDFGSPDRQMMAGALQQLAVKSPGVIVAAEPRGGNAIARGTPVLEEPPPLRGTWTREAEINRGRKKKFGFVSQAGTGNNARNIAPPFPPRATGSEPMSPAQFNSSGRFEITALPGNMSPPGAQRSGGSRSPDARGGNPSVVVASVGGPSPSNSVRSP